jgi:uncharacterized membrane protein
VANATLPSEVRVDPLSGLTLAAPAGVNAYIPLLAVALAERFGWITLRSPFDQMGSWWFIVLVGVLLAVELVADKIPAVDHANDVVQTFVRPAAGGLLAVASSHQGGVQPWLFLIAGVLVAGGVHAVKAAARPVVNVTTGGAGAPVVSTVEDVGAAGVSVLAILVPLLAFLLVVAAVALAVWAVWWWRSRRGGRLVSADRDARSS